MKKFVLILVTGIVLFSCSKKDVSSPDVPNQNVFYEDAHIQVENLQALPASSGEITFSFSTAYEKNIKRIELMSSATTSTFCTTEAVNTTGNSSTLKNYTFQDNNLKGSTMYYMLRFEDNLGQWSYSTYYSVRVY